MIDFIIDIDFVIYAFILLIFFSVSLKRIQKNNRNV